jgi:hypothetical protein
VLVHRLVSNEFKYLSAISKLVKHKGFWVVQLIEASWTIFQVDLNGNAAEATVKAVSPQFDR